MTLSLALTVVVGAVVLASLADTAPPPSGVVGTTVPVPPDSEPSGWQPGDSVLMIGPVDGLTRGWHAVPWATQIPLGTFAVFQLDVPPEARVEWSGAFELWRDDVSTTALCPLIRTGQQQVAVTVGDGMTTHTHARALDVVDIAPDQIKVTALTVVEQTLEIDESLPLEQLNALTFDHFISPSIAAVRKVGDGRYRTSVNRRVTASLEVDPAGFLPLMEWRVNGHPDGLGTAFAGKFEEVATHSISVGPLAAPRSVEIETYRVTITSHEQGVDIIPQGEPVLFTAVTDPPGFEDEITWLSSTKFGTGTPVLGSGPTFEATFKDTFGPHPDGTIWQWLGVKGDNAAVGQDQKAQEIVLCAGACGPDWCVYDVDAIVHGGADCAANGITVGPQLCLYPCVQVECVAATVRLFRVQGTDCFFQASVDDGCADCPYGPGQQWNLVGN